MTHILIPREPSPALLRPFVSCPQEELPQAYAAMIRIAEVERARAGSQCLAQIEEPAGAAPAAVAPRGVTAWMHPETLDVISDAKKHEMSTQYGTETRRKAEGYSVAMAPVEQSAAAPALEAPAAQASKPLAVTPEMRSAFRRTYREGGFWNDRLDYALDRMLAAAPQAPAAPSIPQWIDDPHDIEQGQMLNPAWVQAQAAPAAPVVNPSATWTSADDGLPEHGDLVLCDFGPDYEGGGIQFGYEVLTWDEHHTVAGVARWLKLDRMPESLADHTEIDRLMAAPAVPEDPMDWPLPCDVTVGHGTIRKGCKLRTLVLRMQVLYDLSQKVELAAPAAPAVDASPLLAPETELDAVVRDAAQIIRDAEHYRFIKRHRLILSGGTDTFGWPIAPFGNECDRYIAQELATERAAQAKEGGEA